MVLHVSNRYLDLDGVAAATLPLVNGAKGLIISDDEADGSYALEFTFVIEPGDSARPRAPITEKTRAVAS